METKTTMEKLIMMVGELAIRSTPHQLNAENPTNNIHI